MNNFITLTYLNFRALLLMLIATTIVIFSSCEDGEVGPPVITQVRSTDPSKADSTFTGSQPGKLIVIQGKNFTGLLHVYLNELDASFNPAFCSDNNILVWIPDSVPLSATDPNASNTIKVVTQTGETSYHFRYLAQSPTILFFDFNLPLNVGNTITIVGANFYVIQDVYFINNGDTIFITDYTVSDDYNQISFQVTAEILYNGNIGIITESGTISKEYTPMPPPEITGFSNDLPVQGSIFDIIGIYFGSIEKIIFPNGDEILKNNIIFNTNNTIMTVQMPLSDEAGDLALISSFGDTVIYADFNSRSTVMYDFDTKGNWVWDNTKIESAGTQAGEEPLISNGNFYRITGTVPTNTDWWQEGVLGMSIIWPSASTIPDETSVESLAFSLIINTEMPWTQGSIRISIENAEYFLMPWEDGTVVPVDEWVLYTIPLTAFNNMNFITYGDISSLNPDNTILIMVKTTSEEEFDINFCIDDVRFSIINNE